MTTCLSVVRQLVGSGSLIQQCSIAKRLKQWMHIFKITVVQRVKLGPMTMSTKLSRLALKVSRDCQFRMKISSTF